MACDEGSASNSGCLHRPPPPELQWQLANTLLHLKCGDPKTQGTQLAGVVRVYVALLDMDMHEQRPSSPRPVFEHLVLK